MPTRKEPGKITVEELNRKLADPQVSRKELARYFLPDEERSGQFDPRLRLNPETVEVPRTAEARTRSALALNAANTWARLRRRMDFEAKLAAGYDGPVIVSEGDSWFQYPIILEDVIDVLSERYAIRSLDAAGDTLENMVAENEYAEALADTGAPLFLLSAGGNDALGGGNLKEHLRDFDPALSPADHLLPSYRQLIDHAIALYDTVFRAVEALPGDIVTVCHGYDRPIPRNGRWLGKPMEARGIVDAAMQRAITDVMVDRFNARLKQLADTFPRVRYLDLRGVVGRDVVRWHDELHPTDAGYADVAERFHQAIEAETRAGVRALGAEALAAPARRRGGKKGGKTVPAPGVIGQARTGLSLHAGLNTIDPAHYGDDGALAACEFDAEDMTAIARNAGFEVMQTLTSPKATRKAVIEGIADAAKRLRAGDIFLFTYAGHGSQLPDMNRDEEDGVDETFCLYDGMFVDDELYDLWCSFADDVRVLVIADSCHSGTSIRKAPEAAALAAAATLVPLPTPRFLPPTVAGRTFRRNRDFYERILTKPAKLDERLLVRELARPLRCTVQLISGCQDNQVSRDGIANGRFTEELLKVWGEGRFTGDYKTFHRRIVAGMPPVQTPNHWVIGRPNAAFVAQKPFSI